MDLQARQLHTIREEITNGSIRVTPLGFNCVVAGVICSRSGQRSALLSAHLRGNESKLASLAIGTILMSIRSAVAIAAAIGMLAIAILVWSGTHPVYGAESMKRAAWGD